MRPVQASEISAHAVAPRGQINARENIHDASNNVPWLGTLILRAPSRFVQDTSSVVVFHDVETGERGSL